MTSEEYLRVRGWRPGLIYGWTDPLDPRAVPDERGRGDALDIQVKRDVDCASFVASYQTLSRRRP